MLSKNMHLRPCWWTIRSYTVARRSRVVFVASKIAWKKYQFFSSSYFHFDIFQQKLPGKNIIFFVFIFPFVKKIAWTEYHHFVSFCIYVWDDFHCFCCLEMSSYIIENYNNQFLDLRRQKNLIPAFVAAARFVFAVISE